MFRLISVAISSDRAENSIMQTITIAVSAILIAAGLVTAPGLINNARDNNARQDLANIAYAQEFVLGVQGTYFAGEWVTVEQEIAASIHVGGPVKTKETAVNNLQYVAGQAGLNLPGTNVVKAENNTGVSFTVSGDVSHHAVTTCEDVNYFVAKAQSASKWWFYRASGSGLTTKDFSEIEAAIPGEVMAGCPDFLNDFEEEQPSEGGNNNPPDAGGSAICQLDAFPLNSSIWVDGFEGLTTTNKDNGWDINFQSTNPVDVEANQDKIPFFVGPTATTNDPEITDVHICIGGEEVDYHAGDFTFGLNEWVPVGAPIQLGVDGLVIGDNWNSMIRAFLNDGKIIFKADGSDYNVFATGNEHGNVQVPEAADPPGDPGYDAPELNTAPNLTIVTQDNVGFTENWMTSAYVSFTGMPTPTITLSGDVPDGLELAVYTGYAYVSGTPTEFGEFEYTITATNANGSDSETFSLVVHGWDIDNVTLSNPGMSGEWNVLAGSDDGSRLYAHQSYLGGGTQRSFGSTSWQTLPLPDGDWKFSASDDGLVVVAYGNPGGWPNPLALYVSTDMGNTWTNRAGAYTAGLTPEVSGDGGTIALAPWQHGDPMTMLVSNNLGLSWSTVSVPGTSSGGSFAISDNGDIFYYALGNRVWRSVNQGTTWTETAFNSEGFNPSNKLHIKVSGDGSSIMGIADATSTFPTIYMSHDSGNTWFTTSLNFGAGYPLTWNISDDGQMITIMSSTRIQTSIDGGYVWKQWSNPAYAATGVRSVWMSGQANLINANFLTNTYSYTWK